MATLLIETTDDLKRYLPVEATNSPITFKPSIQKAEESYIKKVIGSAVYARLTDASPTADAIALKEIVCQALAPLAYYLHMPLLNVRAGDKGLTTSYNQNTEQARKWMVDDMRNQLLIDGYNAVDRLYAYLEANTTADWYNDWKASSGYTSYKALFVNRAEVMQQHVNINGNRWLFQQLLPGLQKIESFYIEPTLGYNFFTYLKTEFEAGTLSPQEETAVSKIQQIVSLIAYAEALCNPFFINEYVIVTASRSDDLRKGSTDYKQYKEISDREMNAANGLLNSLKAYLNKTASPTVFTDYYTSDVYSTNEGNTGLSGRTNNDSSNGTFFMM